MAASKRFESDPRSHRGAPVNVQLLATGVLALTCILFAQSALPAQEKARPAITALLVVPEGKAYLQGSQAGVLLRSFAGTDETRLATQLDAVHALAFSPDGKQLAIAGGSPGEAGYVELWSWPERKLQARLKGHEDVIYDAKWLPDGQRLVTASGDRTVRIWNLTAPQDSVVLKGHSGAVLSLALSADGKCLCSGSQDQTIRVWDPEKGLLLRSFDNHFGPVHALAFRPVQAAGQPPYLASASEDGTVRIWQPTIGRMVRIIKHPTPVYGVVWSQRAEQLFTAGKDGTLRTLEDGTATILQQQPLTPDRLTCLSRAGDQLLLGTSRGAVQIPGGDR